MPSSIQKLEKAIESIKNHARKVHNIQNPNEFLLEQLRTTTIVDVQQIPVAKTTDFSVASIWKNMEKLLPYWCWMSRTPKTDKY